MDRWKVIRLISSKPSVATVPRQRRQKSLLALLNLMNYSASAQRPIVAFTREYTWDIESKERKRFNQT